MTSKFIKHLSDQAAKLGRSLPEWLAMTNHSGAVRIAALLQKANLKRAPREHASSILRADYVGVGADDAHKQELLKEICLPKRLIEEEQPH
mmetsp:Transcript_75207/g.118548  ORF Transcript_75207/g.118548 Transcript_75207/m.118548 type:complete len:91 (+) Transcript_75207:16-288(+)